MPIINKSNKPLKQMAVIFSALILYLVSTQLFAQENNLVVTYNNDTQVLSIPKLGIPSGDAGYAYRVSMSLIQANPIGFAVSSRDLLGAIAADEAISAIYRSATHQIDFPSVIMTNNAGENLGELKNVSIALGGDPFVWFYKQ